MNESKPLFRVARREELARIVQLLADDQLGATREVFAEPLPEAYVQAFERIERDPNNFLLVAEIAGALAGCLQMTFIPGLTYTGRTRLLVEGVRVEAAHRGRGIGRAMLEEAIGRAREQGCCMVQLTSNKQRRSAQRFYEQLGFVASHEGYKLHLD